MKKTPAKPMDFNFAKIRERYFISNIFSFNCSLSSVDFRSFVNGESVGEKAKQCLKKGMFFSDYLDMDRAAKCLRRNFFMDWKGPHVHIISVTKRCNSFCSYCGASAGPFRPLESDMTLETARKTLDFIFSVPNKKIMIEFQGGEPLLNFRAVKYIVEKAKKRGEKEGKELSFSIVSNLSVMDGKILKFLLANRVVVCSSLDGPKFIHDLNRKLLKGSSYEAAVRWLGRINALAIKKKFEKPNAICTISRFSLNYPKEIVDEYLRLGLVRIQVGPLDKTGRAKTHWNKVGYLPEEFLSFYERALDYIISLNKKGIGVYEKGAFLFLSHMLNYQRPRYHNLDLLMRLAYNWDGGIYGSDEARMIANSGEETLKFGSVERDSFKDILNRPLSKLLLLSNFNFLNQVRCSRCAWNPYCHAMPALNLSSQNSFWGNMIVNDRCKIYRGIFKLLCRKLDSRETMWIFKKWLSLHES